MTPEQASFFASMLLASIERETGTTRRVLKAILPGKASYRPDPVSRNALELAWHIAHSDVWFLDGFLAGKFDLEDDSMPADIGEASDIVTWYEDSFATSFERVSKLSPEFWATPLDFFGIYNLPAAMYLQFMLVHTVHHRGQLCAYLRSMGGKVPNIYGGSADEPMEGSPQS
jgi:uncharacterized damage-inducible protein DinB